MLQRIHDSFAKWLVVLVLGLIAFSFIFWGVDFGLGGVTTFAAKVTPDAKIPADPADPNKDADPNAAQTIAAAGSPLVGGKVDYQFNALKVEDKKGVLQKVINTLATCLYDVQVPLDPTMTLSYANPLLAAEVDSPHVDSCSGDAPGWTSDTTDAAHPRVKVCGSSYTAYQKVLSDTSLFTLLYGQANEPVPLYAVSKACFDKK